LPYFTYSNHAPGDSPKIADIKEQRLSGFFVSLMTGLSIFAAPLLKQVPIAVLFGVFLYTGVCSMIGGELECSKNRANEPSFYRLISFDCFSPTMMMMMMTLQCNSLKGKVVQAYKDVEQTFD